MKHIDFFSGIGGFALAARWMGWETVGFVEWDAWCQKILKKNFPGVPVWGDIKDFNDEIEKTITDTQQFTSNLFADSRSNKEITKPRGQGSGTRTINRSSSERDGQLYADILTGGFPCQPFSHAGKRKGKEDDRHLWPEMLRSIQIIRPRWVIGENVNGLVSMENGETLDRILTDLEDSGYSTETFLIPACGVGAWHRRERIWIVGYSEEQLQRETELRHQQECEPEGLGEDVPDTISERGCSRATGEQDASNAGESPRSPRNGYWDTEPSVGRVANGIPNRVDRLKGLGNAIVPQVAYEIFKAIEECNTTNH